MKYYEDFPWHHLSAMCQILEGFCPFTDLHNPKTWKKYRFCTLDEVSRAETLAEEIYYILEALDGYDNHNQKKYKKLANLIQNNITCNTWSLLPNKVQKYLLVWAERHKII